MVQIESVQLLHISYDSPHPPAVRTNHLCQSPPQVYCWLLAPWLMLAAALVKAATTKE